MNLNKLKIEALKQEIEELNKKFSRQTSLIDSYQLIVNKLDFARLSEQTLLATIDQFELEMAQNRLPWRILEDPIFKKPP